MNQKSKVNSLRQKKRKKMPVKNVILYYFETNMKRILAKLTTNYNFIIFFLMSRQISQQLSV